MRGAGAPPARRRRSTVATNERLQAAVKEKSTACLLRVRLSVENMFYSADVGSEEYHLLAIVLFAVEGELLDRGIALPEVA